MSAYLAAFFATSGVAVGALILLMVGYLAHATWLVPIRRVVEAFASTIPLLLVLFLPIALFLPAIYPWARPWTDASARMRTALEHARLWYAPAFFVARAYGYLLLWSFFAGALRRASLTRDRSSRAASPRILSAVGLPLVLLTVTFAAFDWVMSLEPGWTSDALGLYVAAGAFAGAVGAVCVLLDAAVRSGLLDRAAIRPEHVHALGRVLLVSVLLWAYIGFCQFLLLWIADLPSEVSFYDERRTGSWAWVSTILVLTHFAMPFFLLLSRGVKRRLSVLAGVGGLVLAAHALDAVWIVIPFGGGALHPLDLAVTLAGLVVLVSAAALAYRAAPPVPLHDPDGDAALHYESP